MLVEYTCSDRVATLTLNRPEKLNAFNDELVVALQDGLRQFRGSVPLRGRGPFWHRGGAPRPLLPGQRRPARRRDQSRRAARHLPGPPAGAGERRGQDPAAQRTGHRALAPLVHGPARARDRDADGAAQALPDRGFPGGRACVHGEAASRAVQGTLRYGSRTTAAGEGETSMAFLDKDGFRLYYEDTAANAPTVLFLHGAGGNHLSWWQQVPVFAEEYRCVTVDQRGFGQSPDVAGGPGPAPPPTPP